MKNLIFRVCLCLMLVVDCRNLVEVAVFGKMLRHLVVSCLLGNLQVVCFLLILRQDDALSCGVKHSHSHHIWSSSMFYIHEI